MDSRQDPLGLVGKRIGGRKYLVTGVVEETTFSIVYKATHLVWERNVAIKVFHVGRSATAETREELLASFIREGALLGELSETCAAICQAREIGALTAEDGDRVPYMVLEWLDGQSLEAVMAADRQTGGRRRTLQEVVELLGSIAGALSCAHARGIAHCDIKPGNILVLAPDPRGEVRCKLLDFGVAKVDGQAPLHPRARRPFTPAFGAPEQFDESYGVPGPWTDVFALALTVVELLTGSDALVGQDVFVLGHQACDKSRRPTPRALGLDLGDEVEQVLSRALAVDPVWRFRDVGEFWGELVRASRSASPALQEVPAPPATVPEVPRPVATRVEVSAPRAVRHRRGQRPALAPNDRWRAVASPFPLVVALAIAAALAFGTDRPPAAAGRHAAAPAAAVAMAGVALDR